MKNVFRLFYFKEVKFGIYTVLLGLIPVTIVIVIFEFLINIPAYQKQLSCEIIDDYDIKMLIYYIVSGCAHIIICSIILYHFYISLKKDTPLQKFDLIKKVLALFLLIVFVLVYFLDAIHIKMAFLSHERLYAIMSKSDFFYETLKTFPNDFLNINSKWFHVFSFFPFLLICLALSVMVFGSFYINKVLKKYLDEENFSQKKIKEDILEINLTLKTYARLLSVVLVSSTIATILFFEVPVALIRDEVIRNRYNAISLSMGVCWGLIFSLTLLFLCIYPYNLAYSKINSMIQSIRIKDDPELEQWLGNNKSYYSLVGNINLILSIISPVAVSLLSSAVSHVIK